MMQNPRAPLEGSWQAEGLTERCDRGALYGGLAGNGSAPRAAFMPLRGRVDVCLDPYKPSKKRNTPAFAAAFFGGEFPCGRLHKNVCSEL